MAKRKGKPDDEPQGPILLATTIAERKLMKKTVSERTGVRPSQLSYILHGKRTPTIRQAAALKDFLGVPMRSWLPLDLRRGR